MNDHVEIGHLAKYDAFRVYRDQVIDLEIWFKIHTNVCNFETASPKIILTHKIFMVSVVLLKIGKHGGFHLGFFRIVSAWQRCLLVWLGWGQVQIRDYDY